MLISVFVNYLAVEEARSLLASTAMAEMAEVPSFPDTFVDISSTVRDRTLSIQSDDNMYTIIEDLPAASKQVGAVKVNESGRKAVAGKTSETVANKSKIPVHCTADSDDENDSKNKPKRGQKGKLKKIKEKYKDQDDEERTLRMQLLQSAGAPKAKGKNKKKNDGKTKVASAKCSKVEVGARVEKAPTVPADDIPVGEATTQKILPDPTEVKEESALNKEENANEVAAEEEVDNTVPSDIDILNALTGIPLSEDELLYALPVVAPYSTLMPYKFVVNMHFFLQIFINCLTCIRSGSR